MRCGVNKLKQINSKYIKLLKELNIKIIDEYSIIREPKTYQMTLRVSIPKKKLINSFLLLPLFQAGYFDMTQMYIVSNTYSEKNDWMANKRQYLPQLNYASISHRELINKQIIALVKKYNELKVKLIPSNIAHTDGDTVLLEFVFINFNNEFTNGNINLITNTDYAKQWPPMINNVAVICMEI